MVRNVPVEKVVLEKYLQEIAATNIQILQVQKVKKKSLSPQFTHFSELPMPVLYEILLKMKPYELKSLLRVPRVSSIIRLAEFKRLYDIKHKINSFTLGKIIKKGDKKLNIKGSDGLTLGIAEFGVEDGLQVHITGDKSLKNTRNIELYLDIAFYIGEGIEFSISGRNYGGFVWLQEFDNPSWILTEVEGTESQHNKLLKRLRRVLKMRRKLEWLPAYNEDGVLQIPQNVPREIFETLKAIMNKHGVPSDLVWLQ